MRKHAHLPLMLLIPGAMLYVKDPVECAEFLGLLLIPAALIVLAWGIWKLWTLVQ